MEDQFVTYEQALSLKELGFNEPCVSYFDKMELTHGQLNDIGKKRYLIAPLKSQVFKWLYEKLNIKNGIMPLDNDSQELLLKELIDKLSSKNLLV
jgi:hypothetical protein